MLKKSLVILFLFAFLATNYLKAQDNKVVILNLKNGYSVKGTIVEQSDQVVKIKTQSGEIFEFRKGDISNTSDAAPTKSSSASLKVRKEFPKAITVKDKILSLSIGFGARNGGGTGNVSVPPLPIAFEYILKDNLFDGCGALGCGGFFGFTSSKIFETKYSRIIVGARGYLHYAFFEKFDTYAGTLLGYRSDNDKYTNPDYGYNRTDSKPIINVFAGCRYFFTDKIAGMAELGGGVSILSVGVAIKLK
jgi:hypothetical protein